MQILSKLDTLYLPLTPMGKKYKSIFHIIHTVHEIFFPTKGFVLFVMIEINSIFHELCEYSALKVKVGANFNMFELPRSLQIQFYVNGKV